MVDVFSMEKRHEIMKKIHNKNTKPEVKIRKELWAKGYRYRINYAELPGKPDIVFIKRRKVIFIHGCFWHGHKECKKNTEPATNAVFWRDKIEKTRVRDQSNVEMLINSGWNVLIVWECELAKHKIDHTIKKIVDFLEEK